LITGLAGSQHRLTQHKDNNFVALGQGLLWDFTLFRAGIAHGFDGMGA
jgi:hypothetical protein